MSAATITARGIARKVTILWTQIDWPHDDYNAENLIRSTLKNTRARSNSPVQVHPIPQHPGLGCRPHLRSQKASTPSSKSRASLHPHPGKVLSSGTFGSKCPSPFGGPDATKTAAFFLSVCRRFPLPRRPTETLRTPVWFHCRRDLRYHHSWGGISSNAFCDGSWTKEVMAEASTPKKT